MSLKTVESLPLPPVEQHQIDAHSLNYELGFEGEGALGSIAVSSAERTAHMVQASGVFEASAHKAEESVGSFGGALKRLGIKVGATLESDRNQEMVAVTEGIIESARVETAVDIAFVRQVLGGFDPGQSRTLDELLERNPEFSPFLAQLKPPEREWADWLSDPDHGATDDQLLNVLQWQNDHHTRMNTMEDGIDQITEVKKEAQAKYLRAVEVGALPQIVAERLETIETDVEFEDLFRLASYQAHGYAHPSDGSVHLSDTERGHVTMHELAHSEIGWLGDREPGTRWVNEAVTTMIAILGEQTETPENLHTLLYSKDDEREYPVERFCLGWVIEASGGSITLESLLETYASRDLAKKAELMTNIESVIAQTDTAKQSRFITLSETIHHNAIQNSADGLSPDDSYQAELVLLSKIILDLNDITHAKAA